MLSWNYFPEQRPIPPMLCDDDVGTYGIASIPAGFGGSQAGDALMKSMKARSGGGTRRRPE
jgi:hypothetical protein